MKRVYTTAQGKKIDIDSLQIANEQTIAVGNMKVNARGDELGPGGRVSSTRNQAMESYYKLHTPTTAGTKPGVVADNPSNAERIRKMQQEAGLARSSAQGSVAVVPEVPAEPKQDVAPEPTEVEVQAPAPQLRGSLAGSVAKQTTVTQELITPPNQTNGPQRI